MGISLRRDESCAAERQDVRLIYPVRSRELDAGAHQHGVTQTGDATMFTKTAIALALILGTASTVLAAPKKHSTNPTHDVYDTRGWYVGSDPDPTVRSMLQRDVGSD
jgi:hypothetical protein